ncbi:DUF1269 domain-containing protein [Streptosporangium algeriense]|uniref:DUF1269 domain-containing protein n=1 Tax=Streptosporangium algeriense TaxID=1682748 RepID=A0ABW3DLX1_9ACTN
MHDLIVIAYQDLSTATQARDLLLDRQRDHVVDIADVAVVERRPDGCVKAHPLHHYDADMGLVGAVAGGLIGLLVLAPITGIALAAVGGGAAAVGGTTLGTIFTAIAGGGCGAMAADTDEEHLDLDWVRELGEHLPCGGAALFVIVLGLEEHPDKSDKVLAELRPYGGHVIRTSLPERDAAHIRAILDDKPNRSERTR